MQDRSQPKPGKSPTIHIKKPQSFVLANGMKVLVVENHKLPRVSFTLTLDNAPFTEGNKKGVDELTGIMIGKGSKKINKTDFYEEIDFMGANINFNAHGAMANSLSKFSGRVLELMAEGALHPHFTEEEFQKEKEKLLEEMKSEEKSIPAISDRVVDALAYGKNHPYGEFNTQNSVNNIKLEDIYNNYHQYFVPENAYLIIIGDVKFTQLKMAVEKLFGPWEKRSIPKNSYKEPTNVDKTQINLIDVPTAVQSEISLVNTLRLKMSDPDYFPAVVANQILGGDFNSYLNMNLREKNGWTYGARSIIGSGKHTTKFLANAAVRNSVTADAVIEAIKEIQRIRTEKVSDEILANVKAGYIGNFVMQVEKPQTIARFALLTEAEKLPANFYENYILSINAVTAEDVLRAAQKFFLIDNIQIIIVGKAAEIEKELEKTNIPIYHFDKYANPIKC